MPKSIYCTFFICLLLITKTHAQSGIWDGGKEQLQQIKENGNKKVNKVKQWKNHIEKWGLDSNYNHGLSLSGRLNTNGWSGGIQYLHQQKRNKTIWQLHFSEIKHEKEIKQQGSQAGYTNLGKTSPFIFGKINNAYTLQLGYGKEQMLFPALMDGNLSVSIRYMAGPALALLKPYYLNLIYVDYTTPQSEAKVVSEKYSEANDPYFLRSGYTLGRDSWSKGLGEMKYIPGLFGEFYFVIESDRPKSFVKSVSIGGNVSFYSSKITIMADNKSYPYLASFFVGLSLGKRWK